MSGAFGCFQSESHLAWGRQCSSSALLLLSSPFRVRNGLFQFQGQAKDPWCIQVTGPLWQLARQGQGMITEFGPPRRVVIITFTIKLVDVQDYPQGNDIVNIVLTRLLLSALQVQLYSWRMDLRSFGRSLQELARASACSCFQGTMLL